VTVVLADQSALIHLALRALLATMPGYAVIAAASTVFETEQLIGRVRPAMLICDTDIDGDSGLELCRRVRRTSAGTRVVILTNRDEPQLARSAIAAGAAGYLLKDSPPGIILASLDGVTTGSIVVDDRLGTTCSAAVPVGAPLAADFSRRESEVLSELLSGLDNKSIAGRLCISEQTVKSHMKAILRKLGARDRAHAIALALGAATPSVRQGADEGI
jgi:DNA-binding NarL/FixJ family response regulator